MAGPDGRPLAAVTGATGFLGRRLVGAIAASGWDVRVLARRPVDAAIEWGTAAPQVVRGDLSQADALNSFAQGADVVVHCAGLIKARSRAEFLAVNAEGARRVAQAAQAAGARLVLVSSLAAREPHLSPYAASKRAGEDAASAVLGERLTTVRPPIIYGPGDRETLVLFQRAMTTRLLPLPAGPASRVALAHVDDVAAVIVAALRGPAGVFAVGGERPQGYDWRDIYHAAARAFGRAARLAPLPRWAFPAAGAASQLAGLFAAEPPIFTMGKAREFLHADWSVAASEQLPAAPPARFDLDQGFADAVAWYRAHRWLS